MARANARRCSLTWASKASSRYFSLRWAFNLIPLVSKTCLRNLSLNENLNKMKRLRKRKMSDELNVY
jgi:hypothetical protein